MIVDLKLGIVRCFRVSFACYRLVSFFELLVALENERALLWLQWCAIVENSSESVV